MDGDVRNDNNDDGTHICDGDGVTGWNFNRCSCWYCNWLSEYDGGKYVVVVVVVCVIERAFDDGSWWWRIVVPPPPPPIPLHDVGKDDDDDAEDTFDDDVDDVDDVDDEEWFPIFVLWDVLLWLANVLLLLLFSWDFGLLIRSRNFASGLCFDLLLIVVALAALRWCFMCMVDASDIKLNGTSKAVLFGGGRMYERVISACYGRKKEKKIL